MQLHKTLHPIELRSTESATIQNAHRPQPQLGPSPLALNVNVRRLSTIRRIEEHSIRPDPQCRRHRVGGYVLEVRLRIATSG
jgi:hypothetical protein